MTNHEHERAIELIARRGTEDLVAADLHWLEEHLGMCAECSQYADAFDDAERLLRAAAITASPALVASTQARVRERALHLQEQRSRIVLVAISFCFGALSSAFSAWLWWRFGGWVADRLGLSQAVVEPGIMLFLLLPPLVIAGAMLAFPHRLLDQSHLTAWISEREGGTQ